jgi:hypothetical protein
MIDQFLMSLMTAKQKMGTDDKALQYLMRTKRDIDKMAGDEYWESLPAFQAAKKLVEGVPVGATCECCGFKGLMNIRHKEGQIVGPECVGHPIGSCKIRGARP